MTLSLSGVCYVVAVVLFILSAFPWPDPWHGRGVAIGLAFFAAGHVIP